ncbi:type II secretion system F family protein [Alteromonadaceae bacterium BrNp21-10]|nr:type II secretion system F family protein [Alteromonadaceae bacterium BrNp21-10]
MASFKYRAYDQAGARSEGNIEATSQGQAVQFLKQQGLLVSFITEQKKSAQIFLFKRNKVSLEDIEFLTAELSLLLASGVRINKGLDIIYKTKANPALGLLIADVSRSLNKGSSLSEALAEHPNVFEPLYCNLVQLGEASGNLSEVFAELAKELKFRRDLQRKIIGSLTYPLVILFVCILSVFFIFNFIIPKMSSLFSDLELVPWYTRALIETSQWMSQYQWLLVLGLLGLIVCGIAAFRRPDVKRWWSDAALRLPILRKIIALAERIRFCGSMAMMLKSGVPVEKALKLANGNIKNLHLQREIDIARKKIKQGSGLTAALSQSVLFPDFFVSLLDIGEQSGNLESVFHEITLRSRQEFESWTERMTTLIEPLLILFMGAFVGGVVVIMLLSMVSINDVGF